MTTGEVEARSDTPYLALVYYIMYPKILYDVNEHSD